MKRRQFITLLGGAAAAWPLAARAQQARNLPIIGLVSMGATPTDPANFRPFLEQMRELGYVDGQNVIFDRRFAAGDDSLIGGLVADLVRRPVNIIVTTGTREAMAAKRATSSIPIVTFIHSDPIGMGLAESLARPGGNVTGLTTMDAEIYGKRIEILKQAAPNIQRVGILISGRQPQYKRDTPWARNFETSAQSLGVALDIVEADENNLDSALAALSARGGQSTLPMARRLRRVRSSIGCRRYLCSENKFALAGCWLTRPKSKTYRGVPPSSSTVSSRERSPPICRSSSPPNSSS